MVEDNGEADSDGIRSNKTLSVLWTVLLGVLGIIAVLEFLDNSGIMHLPYLSDIVAVIFLCSAPLVAVAFWMLRKYIPRDAFWGFLLLFIGVGLLLIATTVFAVVFMIVPEPFQPTPFMVGVFVTMGAGLAVTFLGMLLVSVQLVRHIIQLFRDGRQARIGNEI